MTTANYAKDQPAGFSNRIDRVAVVGAGGRQGTHMTEQLLKTGRHTITALTRSNSQAKLPPGVQVAPVDYADELSIASALAGQQLLIITLAYSVDVEVRYRIVRAAGKAGVRYIVPNIYAANMVVENQGLSDDFSPAAPLRAILYQIESLIKHREATLFDQGTAKINTATLSQYGRAVAALAGLKELPEDENDTSPTVSQFRNKPLYFSSFFVSQQDILHSLQRVTAASDWTIKHQTTEGRMAEGKAEAAAGDLRGRIKAHYSFLFSPEGQKLNFEDKLHNELLGLQKEDLDEVVRDCVEKAENGYNPFE